MERQMLDLHRCCSCLSRLSISQPSLLRPTILYPQSKLKSITHHSSPPSSSRSFSTTQSQPLNSRQKLVKDFRSTPPYPYDIPKYYKQSWNGLYHGKKIRFGNNVPEQGFTITRRSWRPNIQNKNFAIGGKIKKIKVSTSVIRQTRQKESTSPGSIKKYLLSEKPHRLKQLGPFGWKLRWKVMTSKTQITAMNRERKDVYGLPGGMKMRTIVDLDGGRTMAMRLPTYKEIEREYMKMKEDGTWKSFLPQFMGKPVDHVDQVDFVGIDMGAVEAGLVQEDDYKNDNDHDGGMSSEVHGMMTMGGEGGEEIPAEMIPSLVTLEEVQAREDVIEKAAELQGSAAKHDDIEVPEDLKVNETKPAEPKSGDMKIM